MYIVYSFIHVIPKKNSKEPRSTGQLVTKNEVFPMVGGSQIVNWVSRIPGNQRHVPSTDSDPWDDWFFVINLGKYTWILFVKMNSLSTSVPTCVRICLCLSCLMYQSSHHIIDITLLHIFIFKAMNPLQRVIILPNTSPASAPPLASCSFVHHLVWKMAILKN